MKSKQQKYIEDFIRTVVIYTVIFCMFYGIICTTIQLFILINGKNGFCWTRYGGITNSPQANTLGTLRHLTLKANGNYTQASTAGSGSTNYSSGEYDQWLNAGEIPKYLSIRTDGTTDPDLKLTINLDGKVSLCKSYLPVNNISDITTTEYSPEVAVPRVGQSSVANLTNPTTGETEVVDTSYLTLKLYANASEWRNVIEVTKGDEINILVSEPVFQNNTLDVTRVSIYDTVNNSYTTPVDCSASITSSVDPICGRAITSNGQATKCKVSVTCLNPSDYEDPDYYKEEYPNRLWTSSPNYCQGIKCLTKKNENYTSKPCSWASGSSGGCNTSQCANWRGDYYDFSPSEFTQYSFSQDSIIAYSDHYSSDGSILSAQDHPKIVSDFLNQDQTTDCFSAAVSKGIIHEDHKRIKKSSDVTGNETLRIALMPSGDQQDDSNYPYPKDFDISSSNVQQRAWLINGDGILYRYSQYSGSLETNGASNKDASLQRSGMRPSNNNFSQSGNESLRVFLSGPVLGSDVGSSGMLQMNFINNGNLENNTGGYVLYVQHTKCVRNNGEAFDDGSFADRGRVQYYILPVDYDLNASSIPSGVTTQSGDLEFDEGKTDITVDSEILGDKKQYNLWLKIKNNPSDYQDSEGEYSVKLQTDMQIGKFTDEILNPIMDRIDKFVTNTANNIATKIICYQDSDQTDCDSFFKYIKAALTLYILIYGMRVSLGMVQVNHSDLIKHSAKIIFIAGLMDNRTFTFFNEYLYGIITSGMDVVMAEFGGGPTDQPLTALDEVLTRMLMNPIVYLQTLTLLSFGIGGIAMFFAVMLGIIIYLVTIFGCIITYVFNKIILAFLISIGPIFLVFVLFEPTKKLFQSWVNNILRCIIEPVVLILGISIYSKLFMSFLDRALAFSVCFKCSIPFKMPNIFASVFPLLPPVFYDLVIFCINWFGAWGIDSRVDAMGIFFPGAIGMLLTSLLSLMYFLSASQIVSGIIGVGFTASSVTASMPSDSYAKRAVKTGYAAAKLGAKKTGKATFNLARQTYNRNRIKENPDTQKSIDKVTTKKTK
ncbi:MAG: type IV secretion system protein [Rickettsiaceae bacterium]|nr:type IV secretion system protein [Rickettsiaceae bacterium]